ncbi:MAG: hypothetical protein ABSB09_14075 [Acidimicrobiales bacterium]
MEPPPGQVPPGPDEPLPGAPGRGKVEGVPIRTAAASTTPAPPEAPKAVIVTPSVTAARLSAPDVPTYFVEEDTTTVVVEPEDPTTTMSSPVTDCTFPVTAEPGAVGPVGGVVGAGQVAPGPGDQG